MPVTDVRKDLDALTMTMTAEFDAAPARVWQVWKDPRQLERWWGPPTYPATVTEHELVPGGKVAYFMTGPEGDRHHGWWVVRAVESPYRLEFEDGFADEGGAVNDALPVTATTVTLADREGGGTVMTVTATFPSREDLDRLLAMGVEEGLRSALAQVDGILAA